jgi:amphiphysin
MLQTHRQSSGSSRSPSITSKTSGLGRAPSASYASKKETEAYGAAPPSRTLAAPPPYTSTASTDSIKKKAPPPPPPLKPKPSFGTPKVYCTAIFDFEAQVGDPVRVPRCIPSETSIVAELFRPRETSGSEHRDH